MDRSTTSIVSSERKRDLTWLHGQSEILPAAIARENRPSGNHSGTRHGGHPNGSRSLGKMLPGVCTCHRQSSSITRASSRDFRPVMFSYTHIPRIPCVWKKNPNRDGGFEPRATPNPDVRVSLTHTSARRALYRGALRGRTVEGRRTAAGDTRRQTRGGGWGNQNRQGGGAQAGISCSIGAAGSSRARVVVECVPRPLTLPRHRPGSGSGVEPTLRRRARELVHPCVTLHQSRRDGDGGGSGRCM